MATIREDEMKKKPKYTTDLPRRIYTYFAAYSGQGAPSLSKFAREVGITVEDIRRFRERHREFDRAIAECNEIRRDYLIDNALTRRFDPSLVKYLLENERIRGGDEDSLDIRLEVVE